MSRVPELTLSPLPYGKGRTTMLQLLYNGTNYAPSGLDTISCTRTGPTNGVQDGRTVSFNLPIHSGAHSFMVQSIDLPLLWF